MGSELQFVSARKAKSEAEPEAPRQEPSGPVAPFPVTIGAAGDLAEAAADRHAETALRRLPQQRAGAARSATAGGGVIGAAGGTVGGDVGTRINQMRGSGAALPAPVRSRMESAFGVNFDRVRVHANDTAAALSQTVSAAAFTTGQDIFFGRNQFAPETASGERVLAHELAHTLQPDQRTARRQFVYQGRPGSVDTVLQTFQKERNAVAALAKLVPGVATEYIIRKLSQGPDIDYVNAMSVVTAAKQALESNPNFFDRDARRLARMVELMVQRLKSLDVGGDGGKQESAKVSAPFTKSLTEKVQGLLEIVQTPNRTVSAQKTMLDIIAETREQGAKDNRWLWKVYTIVSQFGPLSFQLSGQHRPDARPDQLHDQITAALRALRMVMARKDNIGVVAHRGTGPTNRTMGGLIGDDDNRRKNRDAENSPQAFATALSEVSKTSENEGLDGVECDVFLSSDGIPIVTHEGKIREQLMTLAKRKALDGADHVHERTAGELVGITRGASPDSRFMTLQELIAKVLPSAIGYHDVTGRPFRLEIEMKGTGGKFGPDQNISEKSKKELRGAGGQHFLRAAVTKVISRLQKKGDAVPIEFVLFNGKEDSAHDFAETRQKKVALGDITVALGATKIDSDPADIDELRFGVQALINANGNLGLGPLEYIMTGVFAQEFAPKSMNLRAVEPSRNVKFEAPQPTQEKPRPRAKVNQDVSNDIRKRQLGDQVTDETQLDDVIELIRSKQIDFQLFRMLTDYPAKAAYIKQLIGPVLAGLEQPVVQPTVEQPVRTAVEPQRADPRLGGVTEQPSPMPSLSQPSSSRSPAPNPSPSRGWETKPPSIQTRTGSPNPAPTQARTGSPNPNPSPRPTLNPNPAPSRGGQPNPGRTGQVNPQPVRSTPVLNAPVQTAPIQTAPVQTAQAQNPKPSWADLVVATVQPQLQPQMQPQVQPRPQVQPHLQPRPSPQGRPTTTNNRPQPSSAGTGKKKKKYPVNNGARK